METGAFGWKFHDEMQPILDAYDRQMEDIRRNGAEGLLARMQAQDDAIANSVGGQFSNVGIQFGAGNRSFGSPPNIPQLGPDGPNSAVMLSGRFAPQETLNLSNTTRGGGGK